ncbi:1,4-alpha-glucan branching protein [Nonomuraea sp. PA05]|uniref:maltokinase N-terminal cap-like domain-containing protein n=1 Tax=Nonomuraea sp. PA05 TaxID=2604466 RepID=UPI0011D6E4E8|nr:1,4-alpha-glucan branching protein [Nonomuraea sp. PA05]TYB50649.1 1,4-alpha-glucan branching protein [Nonomuraea sp. PA05]
MAVIHRTELKPTKLELLTAWLPTRPWYRGGAPELVKAGGFRLDDPEGAVGIEFMVVTDVSGPEPASYLVPLTYRGAPLDGAEHALVGTMEHGVLGRRWAYDGCHDPVLVGQLLALIGGKAEAQDQNASDTPDREVTRSCSGPVPSGLAAADDDREGTELRAPDGTVLRVRRLLHPDANASNASNGADGADGGNGADGAGPGVTGYVAGAWNLLDGTRVRGLLAVLSE